MILKRLQPTKLKVWQEHLCSKYHHIPVNAFVVVSAVEELDFFKGLLTGVVTGQIGMHAQKQIESGSS